MPRKYKKPIMKRFSPVVEEEVILPPVVVEEVILPPIVVEEVILPPIVVEDGYETPDEIGITMPENVTWAPQRKYTRNDDIGVGNNFYINKFPKI